MSWFPCSSLPHLNPFSLCAKPFPLFWNLPILGIHTLAEGSQCAPFGWSRLSQRHNEDTEGLSK